MEEFKGTKAKWKYEVKYGKSTPRITVQIPVRENYNLELILGRIREDDCIVSSCCCKEEHANAKLIAAAPELLEALLNLHKAISSGNAHELSEWNYKSKILTNKILNP